MSKTEKNDAEIGKEIEEVFKNTKTEELYKVSIINKKLPREKPSQRRYSEIAAGIILSSMITKLEDLKLDHGGREDYNQHHDGRLCGERFTAINIFNNFDFNSHPKFNSDSKPDFPHIGKILDYETPLKKDNKDKGVGKIDLLSYKADKHTAYLLELKIENNKKDTLLRSILEVYTYGQIVNEENLRKSFDLSSDTLVKKAVLLFKGCTAYEQYHDETNNKNIITLMEKLDVVFFCVKEDTVGVFDISDKVFEE